MFPVQMSEQTANDVMAYAAVGNFVLALVLAGITSFYAWHAKRQADATKEQVAASNRQADAAQNTLDLLLKEKEQQRRTDISTVRFQLEAAIQMIDDWQNRIKSESFDLPDVIEMRPTNFDTAIPNADRIDQLVAEYMGAALLYVAKAETDIRVMRDKNPDRYADSPLAMGVTAETRERLLARAAKNLNVAKCKLDEAKARLSPITEREQTSHVSNR
jgi:light-regulated signal transduction histidine kinase (bacteriophytochrome)